MMDARPRSQLSVCLVTPSYAPDLGGLASIVSGLADALQSLGCHVEVATQVSRGIPRGVAPTSVIPVHRFNNLLGGRRFGYSPRLTWWLWRNQRHFDLIHVFSYHAPVGLMTAATVSRPIVFTPTFHGGGHSSLAAAVHIFYRRVSGLTFRRSRAVICGSHAEREAMLEEFPEASDRTVVIPFAIEARVIRAPEPFPTRHPVVLSAGRLDDYKQNDVLILAMKFVTTPARLVLCGDGPDRTRLDRLVKVSGLNDSVDVLGYVSDEVLVRWRSTASVIASLSTHESFGLSLVEGALTGAPLVLTDIAPHREVVGLVGANAEFVDLGASPRSVADAIDRAFKLGRSKVPLTLPSWEVRARETMSVYEAVINGEKLR